MEIVVIGGASRMKTPRTRNITPSTPAAGNQASASPASSGLHARDHQGFGGGSGHDEGSGGDAQFHVQIDLGEIVIEEASAARVAASIQTGARGGKKLCSRATGRVWAALMKDIAQNNGRRPK